MLCTPKSKTVFVLFSCDLMWEFTTITLSGQKEGDLKISSVTLTSQIHENVYFTSKIWDSLFLWENFEKNFN